MLLAMLLPVVALAQPVGELALGERIAVSGGGDAVTACNTCHGDRGQGMPAFGFPALAGRSRAWLLRDLDAYADGSREHPIMSPIAKAMSHRQRAATAAWFASLPLPR